MRRNIESEQIYTQQQIPRQFQEINEESYSHELSTLRRFLEQGNQIPLKKQTHPKQKQIGKNQEHADSINYSTTSNSSRREEEWEQIDFQYVLQCAQNNLLATCEELLAFDQEEIFERLLKEFYPAGGDKRNPVGIDKSELMGCESIRAMYWQYSQRRKERGQVKKAGGVLGMKQPKGGVLERIYKILGSFSVLFESQKVKLGFKILFCALLLLFLFYLAKRHRQNIAKAFKYILNIQ